ncbi:MAG: hypothetical protein K2J32_12795 [Ruminococcus sp.]|nr:hypothetical protein [Ruminococcus sp.]
MINKKMMPKDSSHTYGGASNYNDYKKLKKHFKNPVVYELEANKTLTEGLGIYPDADGHYTIYPIEEMSFGKFQDLVRKLPWNCLGRLKDLP